MKETNTISLNLNSYIHCPRLYSRLVWQHLFDEYRKGNGSLSCMDNMLCDLIILQREFDKGEDFTLYWGFNLEHTHMGSYGLSKSMLKITYCSSGNEVTIERCEGLQLSKGPGYEGFNRHTS